jgi:hypothetical protein
MYLIHEHQSVVRDRLYAIYKISIVAHVLSRIFVQHFMACNLPAVQEKRDIEKLVV